MHVEHPYPSLSASSHMLCNGPGDVACGGAKALDLESRQCHCALCRSFELKTAEGRARALMTELKDLREEKREAFQRAIALREEGLRVALAMSTVHPASDESWCSTNYCLLDEQMQVA